MSQNPLQSTYRDLCQTLVRPGVGKLGGLLGMKLGVDMPQS